MITKIDSTNRNAARKILTAYFAATDVRTWTVARLHSELCALVNGGLATVEGINRALAADSKFAAGARSNPAPESPSNTDDGEGPDAESDDSDDDGEAGAADAGDDGDSDDEADGGDGDSDDDRDFGDDDGDDDGEDDGDEAEADDEAEGDAEGESENDDTDEDTDDDDGAADDDDRDYDDNGPIRHEVTDRVKAYIAAGLNVALVGPAGSGKSTITENIAEDLGITWKGTGAVMSKYDLVGFVDAGGSYRPTPLSETYDDGGLFCFDEADASAPDAVVAFNGVTDNQSRYAFPDGMHTKHEDFVAVCCMNTYGNGANADYVGRFKQDAASMSRWVKVHVDYDRAIEKKIGCRKSCELVWSVRDAVSHLGIRHVVSTRMIYQVKVALEAGVKQDWILDDIVFAGLTDDQRRQIESYIESH